MAEHDEPPPHWRAPKIDGGVPRIQVPQVEPGPPPTPAQALACQVLFDEAVRRGSPMFVLDLGETTGTTPEGVNVSLGRWRITVEQVEPPPAAGPTEV